MMYCVSKLVPLQSPLSVRSGLRWKKQAVQEVVSNVQGMSFQLKHCCCHNCKWEHILCFSQSICPHLGAALQPSPVWLPVAPELLHDFWKMILAWPRLEQVLTDEGPFRMKVCPAKEEPLASLEKNNKTICCTVLHILLLKSTSPTNGLVTLNRLSWSSGVLCANANTINVFFISK